MSILGTLTRRHSSVPSTSINACSRVAQDLPLIFGRALGGDTPTRSDRNRQHGNDFRRPQPAQSELEHVFIQSLVAAGHCRHHRAHLSRRWQQGARGWGKKDNKSLNTVGSRRGISTNAKRQEHAVAKALEEEEPLPMPEISKEEYKDIVNTYGTPSDMWDQPAFGLQGRSSKRKSKGQPLAPRLVVTPREEDQPPYAPRVVLEPEDDHHEMQLDRLHDLLRRPRGKISHATLWKTYRALRAPRLRYMSDWMIRTLMSHLTWTERVHDETARKRYFSILEDCLGEQVQLTEKEWTSAIQFAGRAVKESTDHEVKDAIELWLKMEEAGVKADNVTFNTLFYVAVKAGRFALADTVYSELKARGMELDRYFRISWIYYAGLRGEGDGVRKAFNDMVNAGEIIDSAVMNCVIVSLIRSGEAGAADHVFRKMKALHAEKFGTRGPDDWRGQRQLAKMLNKAGKQLRAEREAHERSFFGTHFSGDDRREQLQEASPINPNARTYRILLRYCCRVSGELDRVKELLAENKERGFHIQGSVYLDIFTAFIIHGGFAHSEWKPSVLEHFWKDFLEASTAPNAGYWLSTGSQSVQTLHFNVGMPDEDVDVDQSVGPGGMLSLADEGEDPGRLAVSEEDKTPYFTLSLAKVVIRAFAKCMGTPRMLEVAEEIKARWKDCNSDDLLQLERFVESKRVDR